MRISRFVKLASAAAMAAALTAAPAAAESVHRTVGAYVDQLFEGAPSGAIPLFYKQVCPAAYGLTDALNGAITDRMRAVAAAAGLSVADKGCRANLLLFVPKDRGALMAQLHTQRSELFGQTSDRLLGDPEAGSAPTLAWQLLEQRGADGRSISGGRREGQPMIQEAVTTSRLLPSGRSDLDVAVVVFDTQAALGFTPTQLADYAVMRALVPGTNKAPNPPVPSILSIFRDKQAGKASPLSVTQWDLAFLKALYADRGSAFTGGQRARVEEAMSRALPESASAE